MLNDPLSNSILDNPSIDKVNTKLALKFAKQIRFGNVSNYANFFSKCSLRDDEKELVLGNTLAELFTSQGNISDERIYCFFDSASFPKAEIAFMAYLKKQKVITLIQLSSKVIAFVNENMEEFVSINDQKGYKERLALFNKESDLGSLWSINQEYPHPFFHTSLIYLVLYPLFESDLSKFAQQLQLFKYPDALASILSWKEIRTDLSVMEFLLKESDLIENKGTWNHKILAPLLFDLALEYTQEIIFKDKHLCASKSDDEMNCSLADTYINRLEPFYTLLARRKDVFYFLREWYSKSLCNNRFPGLSPYMPHIVSMIGKALAANNKSLSLFINPTSVNDETIRPLLLAKIWMTEDINFDASDIELFYRFYKNDSKIFIYPLPQIGFLTSEHRAFAQLFLNNINAVSLWQLQWDNMAPKRTRLAYSSEESFLLNSSCYHVLVGVAIIEYLQPDKRSTAILLLSHLWQAMVELYLNYYLFKADFINYTMSRIIILYYLLDKPQVAIECLSFIKDNPLAFVSACNQLFVNTKEKGFFINNSSLFKVLLDYKELQGKNHFIPLPNAELLDTFGAIHC
jgi:hypothetical protein